MASSSPAESFLAQDAADGGAAERGAFLAEPGADLVDRQALAAQLDHPAAGAVLAGAVLGPGLPGGANSWSFPARKSRSRLAMLARV